MSNVEWPTASPDGLGEIVGADDVRDAVKATIDTWSPYYLSILSQRLATANRIGPTGPLNGQDQPIIPTPLQSFGTWENEPTFRSIGTGMPAMYLVTSPGTVGVPKRRGDGTHDATYAAVVTVHVFGLDWQTTADLTSWYEKVVRWSVMQHRSLGSLASTVKWLGSAYEREEHDSKRTLGRALLRFDVVIEGVLDDTRGPASVPAEPWTPPGVDPTVQSTTAEVSTLTKYPVTQSLPANPQVGQHF